MTDIQAGPIGSVGQESVKFEGGKLVVAAQAKVSAVEANVSLAVSADPVIDLVFDKLAAAIPGKWDDVVLAEAKAALKAYLAAQG